MTWLACLDVQAAHEIGSGLDSIGQGLALFAVCYLIGSFLR